MALRTFNSSIDYAKDAVKYYELAKDRISSRKAQKLSFLIDFINALTTQNFDTAQSTLHAYHELISTAHTIEQNFQLIDLKNVRRVKKFYAETQQILASLKKEIPEDEPETLSGKKP